MSPTASASPVAKSWPSKPKAEAEKRRLKKIGKREYDPTECWGIVTVTLDTSGEDAP